VRGSKRRNKEQDEGEHEQAGLPLFSLGSATSGKEVASGGRARKRLPMSVEAKRNVPFTKLSTLSPKKVCEGQALYTLLRIRIRKDLELLVGSIIKN
jgi:hypothetical protein